MGGYIGSRVVVPQVDGYTKAETQTLVGNATKSNAEVKTAYEANADTNEFSDAEVSKLAGIAAGATAGVAVDYSEDITRLYLNVAEAAASRFNMADGILDGYNGSSDVDLVSSTDMAHWSDSFLPTKGALLSSKSMTSNVLPSPFVASASNGAATAWEVHDGTTVYESTGAHPSWHKIDIGSNQTVGSYGMASGVNTSVGFNYTAWTFEGSTDDSTWVELDSRTGFTDWGAVVGAEIQFKCTSGSYRYYRWNPTAGGTYSSGLHVYGLNTTPATLISEPFIADVVPATARVGVLVDGAFTINTTLIASVSRDGGTTFTAATLVLIDTMSGGYTYYEDAAVDISAQPSGTSMVYKVYSNSGTFSSISAALLQWG